MTGQAPPDSDTAEQAEGQHAQAALWDPLTVAVLEDVGVAAGWHCLEVGAGTGSVAAWLADRVAGSGRVVATDLDTRRLEPLAAAGVEIRRHDVVVDPLEPARYDLVHARLVLEHLPQRRAVLAKLSAALRPGGWLVVDDYDLGPLHVTHPPHALWTKIVAAVRFVLAASGADVHYGRALPAAFVAAGLGEVTCKVGVFLQRAPETGAVIGPALRRMRGPIVERGLASDAQVDQILAELADPGSALWIYSPLLVSTRGRRGTEEGPES